MSIDYFPEEVFKFTKLCNCLIEDCTCVENNEHEWSWDTDFESISTVLSKYNLEVKFHPGFSSGTAAIRGNKAMEKGRHHYWEIKMVTGIYGTDVMVGVGTKNANLKNAEGSYCSLLGKDRESWGFSYKGYLQHAGEIKDYANIYSKYSYFKAGSSVGVHLDTWRGTLQFYIDREPLGIAFTGLQDTPLYPMVCSTAAKSIMRISCSSSVEASLQVECLAKLSAPQKAYLTSTFPGLRYLSESIFATILRKTNEDSDDDDDNDHHLTLLGYESRRQNDINYS